MNLRVLKYFATVADEGSLTKAAQRLHISQPPLSTQLKKLETDLGVQLFHRTPQGVVLTDAGKYLRMRTDVIFQAIEQTETTLHKMSGAGAISIGCVPTVSETYLSQWLMNIKEKHSRFEYHIFEGDTSAILNLLDEGKVDIGVVRLPIDTERYCYEPIAQDVTYAAVNEENPLCQSNPGESIPFQSLLSQPLILPIRQQAILPLSDTMQDQLDIICHCRSISQGLLMVKKGLGVSIVPGSAQGLSIDHSGIRFYKIISPTFTSTVVIAWNRGTVLPPAIQEFILNR